MSSSFSPLACFWLRLLSEDTNRHLNFADTKIKVGIEYKDLHLYVYLITEKQKFMI